MTVPASIRMRLVVVVVACGGLAALPWSAAAQLVGANLSGVVTDDSGGALPGVTVTVTNRGNGFQVAFVTATDGKYRAVSLQPGAYEVVAELTGFTRQTRQLNLTVGADATLDLQLGVGVIEETVMVSGSASLVEVTRSQPSSAVIGEQIASLPVLERNFLSLAQLMPGAAPDQRPNRFSITKFGGAADQRNSLHHDHRRRRYRRRHPGQPDDQPVAGRRPGIQGLPQPVRRAVRQCSERRGRGGLEVRHQPAARHRLLLRPRRRAERQERLRQDQARVPAGPRRRFGRRSAAPQQDLLLRHLRVQRRQRRADHRPAGQQSVRHRRERHLPLGPHQSPLQHQARPPVQRAALAVRPLRVRRPVHPAQQQHHLGLAPGRRLQHHAQRGRARARRSCRPGWSTACGCIS